MSEILTLTKKYEEAVAFCDERYRMAMKHPDDAAYQARYKMALAEKLLAHDNLLAAKKAGVI